MLRLIVSKKGSGSQDVEGEIHLVDSGDSVGPALALLPSTEGAID